MSKESLYEAVNIVGGQVALAVAIRKTHPSSKVTQAHIWNWLNSTSERGRVPPAEYCRAIEQATNGQITRYDLRPDVFGEAPEATKEAA